MEQIREQMIEIHTKLGLKESLPELSPVPENLNSWIRQSAPEDTTPEKTQRQGPIKAFVDFLLLPIFSWLSPITSFLTPVQKLTTQIQFNLTQEITTPS